MQLLVTTEDLESTLLSKKYRARSSHYRRNESSTMPPLRSISAIRFLLSCSCKCMNSTVFFKTMLSLRPWPSRPGTSSVNRSNPSRIAARRFCSEAMWLFFFSCSVSRGLSLSAADAAAGFDESAPLALPAGAGDDDGSGEIEETEAGGCADGMVDVARLHVSRASKISDRKWGGPGSRGQRSR